MVSVRGDSAGQARSGRPRARTAWTAAALLLVTAGLARSQPSPAPGASGALASLPVAGGAAALAKVAGVDIATPRGLVLLQVIRAVHESPTGADPARDRRIERLHAYLADLSGFLRARRALPEGRMSARLAQSRESRRAVEDAARAVGGELDEQGGVYRFVSATTKTRRGAGRTSSRPASISPRSRRYSMTGTPPPSPSPSTTCRSRSTSACGLASGFRWTRGRKAS